MTSNGDAFRFWQVGSWRQLDQIEREGFDSGALPATFTRNGKQVALLVSPHRLLLLETQGRRRLATLEVPDTTAGLFQCFNPAGDRLFSAVDSQTVRVWDLRRLREQLSEMGLDWDAPAYGPARRPVSPAPFA